MKARFIILTDARMSTPIAVNVNFISWYGRKGHPDQEYTSFRTTTGIFYVKETSKEISQAIRKAGFHVNNYKLEGPHVKDWKAFCRSFLPRAIRTAKAPNLSDIIERLMELIEESGYKHLLPPDAGFCTDIFCHEEERACFINEITERWGIEIDLADELADKLLAYQRKIEWELLEEGK